MTRLAKNFSSSEFRCHDCGSVKVDEKLVQGLQKLRDKIGVPIVVTSGYRCHDHNQAIGGVVNSLHLTGQAADIATEIPLRRLYFEAVGIEEFGGVGIYPGQKFIHVDTRSKPARWGKIAGKYVPITEALDALKGKRDDEPPSSS